MSPKVAIVSGSNKGIGLAIVEGLLKSFEGVVYLTARDVGRGQEAVKLLNEKGLKPNFHQLDISDRSSIEAMRDHVVKAHGGIDILVNNAGIAFKNAATEPMHVQAKQTIAVNYFGTKQACEIFYPILKDGARVVNVSSSAGFLGNIPSQELKEKFASSDSALQVDELDRMMNDFIAACENGDHGEKGWPNSTYVVSKVGLSALTRIQNREMQNTRGKADIEINHVHPGYVDTDMTSHKGHLTPEQGAYAPLKLALSPPNSGVTGRYFWYTGEEIDWVHGQIPGRR